MNILDLGPLYGPVNRDGLPILGQSVFKEVFTGEWNEEWPLNVPKPGCQNLTTLYIQDGQLMASGQMTDPPVMPAMWGYDDLQVVVSLVYGMSKQSMHPSFDLQATHNFAPNFMQKTWSPFWLERTNYGKTMFCVYYWLQAFLASPERFDICSKDKALDTQAHEMGQQCIRYLKELKAQFNFTSTDKVILKPTDTYVDFKEEEQFLTLKRFDMAVEVHRLDEKNQYLLREDESYAFNSVFQNTLREILPVFHRVYAIVGLYKCVDYFKERGFVPDRKYIDMAKQDYGELSKTE